MKVIELTNKLDSSREKFLTSTTGLDKDKIIYPEGSWTIKDIMVNIAFWEFEGAKSVEAFLRGEKYFTPDFSEGKVDEINKKNFAKTQDSSFETILKFFQSSRKLMKEAIGKVEDKNLNKIMMCPWKKESSVEHFINEMIEHEKEHLLDILEV